MSSILRFFLFLALRFIYDKNSEIIDNYFIARKYDAYLVENILQIIIIGLILYEIFVMIRFAYKKDSAGLKVSALVFVFYILVDSRAIRFL